MSVRLSDGIAVSDPVPAPPQFSDSDLAQLGVKTEAPGPDLVPVPQLQFPNRSLWPGSGSSVGL